MTTNFFENIAALNVPGSWKLAIHNDAEGIFTVSVAFDIIGNGDKAAKGVAPMALKGTGSEMDEGFFAVLAKPVQETAGLFRNMEAYMKSLDEAKQKSKMEQDKKTAAAKPAASETDNAKAQKEQQYKAVIKAITDLTADCKYEDALKLLPAVEDYPDKEKELGSLKGDLNRKAEQLKQVSMF